MTDRPVSADQMACSEAFEKMLWELANLYANGYYYLNDLPFSARVPRESLPPDAFGVSATYYRLLDAFHRNEPWFDEAEIRQIEGLRAAERKWEKSGAKARLDEACRALGESIRGWG